MRTLILLAPLTLAACGTDGNSSIAIDGEDGNVSIVAGADGDTVIEAPGISGSIKLPKIDIDEADFQVNGIKLYPGSTIRNFHLDASESRGADKGRMTVAFEAPAALGKVQAWFRDNMEKRRFKVAPAGNGFAGTTDEGAPVTVELEADGADKSKGQMTIGT